MDKLRKCNKCVDLKKPEEFYNEKPICKKCYYGRISNWQKNNRDRVNIIQRRYRQKRMMQPEVMKERLIRMIKVTEDFAEDTVKRWEKYSRKE